MQLDLLVKIEYLLYRDGVLLIEGILQLDLSVLLSLQRIDRRLNVVLLVLEGVFLRLQRIDLGLRNGKSRGGHNRKHCAHRYYDGQGKCQYRSDFFL